MQQDLDIKYIEKVDGAEWCLVRTMPRCELNAENFFLMNDIPCYLPKYNKVYVNKFKGKNGKEYSYDKPPVRSPMFPSYIFAAFDYSTTAKIRTNKNIATVYLHKNFSEDKLIEDLRAVQVFEFLAQNNKVEISSEIQIGTKIIIKRGPFKGWEGIVEKRMAKNFVWINISSIEFNLGIQLSIVDCDKIESF